MMTLAILTETARKDWGLVDKDYGVVAPHRPSNVDNPDVLASLCQALAKIAKQNSLVFPFHPRTARNLREFGLYDRLNREIMGKDDKSPPLFWDGNTAVRVVQAIRVIFAEGSI